MSEIKKDLLYTKDHEWVKNSQGRNYRVGITDFAQSSLGDVTYLQLPQIGQSLKKGEVIGSVESVKAVSDIYAPLSGTVTKINDSLVSDPAPINTDPFGEAWMFELEISSEDELKSLLSPQAYEAVSQ